MKKGYSLFSNFKTIPKKKKKKPWCVPVRVLFASTEQVLFRTPITEAEVEVLSTLRGNEPCKSWGRQGNECQVVDAGADPVVHDVNRCVTRTNLFVVAGASEEHLCAWICSLVMIVLINQKHLYV